MDGPDLHPALLPYAWLLGTWEGEGVGGYPTIEDFPYTHRVQFGHAGKPVLSYTSMSWSIPDGRSLAGESGYWRPQPEDELEVVLAHGSGIAEVSVGKRTGARIELRSDVLARTSSAVEVTALQRLYGLVDGELMYAVDMAAVGQPLQPHLSGRLHRISAPVSATPDAG